MMATRIYPAPPTQFQFARLQEQRNWKYHQKPHKQFQDSFEFSSMGLGETTDNKKKRVRGRISARLQIVC